MNSQFLLEKLESSEEFKKFISENKDAYICSGFFDVDLAEKDPASKYHFDFYVPSKQKTFSFELEKEIKLVELERGDALPKVSLKFGFDIDEIKDLIMKEMESKNIKNKIQKMIFSLQCKDNKDFLLGTIFLTGFGLLRANIDLETKKVSDFEKMSMLDLIKIVKK